MNYFYDDNNVRYTLASTQGGKALNWFFFPGGPGVDSRFFLDLVNLLQCPGNSWLVDFPGNGGHHVEQNDFDRWLSIFVPTLRRFPNPVFVGHSFGAQLPLLFPELEDLLKGCVLLNGSPGLWLEAAAQFAKEHNLPDLTEATQEFTNNPTQETFAKALPIWAPYYFAPHSLEAGRKLLQELIVNLEAVSWWQHKAVEMPYHASWIPQKVKTLIISGEFDAMLPFALFEQDMRFTRPNIQKICIQNAGHLPWFEKPQEMKALFQSFEVEI